MNSQQMMEAFVNWANDQGLETWERIAAQAAWMAATDRLARLCEAKDAEYNELDRHYADELADGRKLRQQLSEAQTQMAMQAELLKEIDAADIRWVPYILLQQRLEKTLSATAETVAAWRAKETEELSEAKAKLDVLAEVCTNAGCENLDDLKAMLNAAKETAPLRREVAMLCKLIQEPLTYLAVHGWDVSFMQSAISNTQATALAYEREVENRGAVKVLEDAKLWVVDEHAKGVLQGRIDELRANKGE